MKKTSATVLLLFIALFSNGQDVKRIGGYMGGGGRGGGFASGKADEIRSSEGTPVVIRFQALPLQLAESIFKDQILSMYAKTDTNEVVQTHRWTYTGDNRWTRETIKDNTIRVLQHIGGCRYLAESMRWHTWQADFVPTGEEAFAIDLYIASTNKTGSKTVESPDKQKALIVDGQRLILANFKNTGEVYSYTSVLGSKATVRVMKGIIDFFPIAYDDFEQAIFQGHSFNVLLDKKVRCPACDGRGTMSETQEDKRKIGTSLCKTCKGKKEYLARVLHKIQR